MTARLALIDPRWLTRRRLRAGFTQAAFATEVGVSKSFVEKLESGTRAGTSPPVATKIAEVLGCDIDDLFEVREAAAS